MAKTRVSLRLDDELIRLIDMIAHASYSANRNAAVESLLESGLESRKAEVWVARPSAEIRKRVLEWAKLREFSAETAVLKLIEIALGQDSSSDLAAEVESLRKFQAKVEGILERQGA